MKNADRRDERGFVLAVVLHLVLLAFVLGMVVFLAVRHAPRIDVTQDRLYTLTESTHRVLEGLDDRVVVEAYFSPDDELPTALRDQRRLLRNVLEEYSASSEGLVQIRYFDPQSDTELRRKAERLGLQPQRIQDVEGATLANKEIWQGFRLRYGARKQKVVPFLFLTDQTSKYEAALTPTFKGLTVVDRPRIGVVSWPSLPPMSRGFGGGNEGAKQFTRIFQSENLTDRYEFVPVELGQGQHVPDDIGTLLLIRPKDLTDRQKYVIDQFLMRGNTLVVFADNDDVSIGRTRMFQTRPVAYDAPDSETEFLEQLGQYGVATSDRVVADQLSKGLPFVVQVGPQQYQPVPYPYWFQPQPYDWAEAADELARVEGVVDETAAASYRERFEPGIAESVLRVLTPPPVLLWPVPVELADPVPDGVTGEVLMRTSPRAIVEPLPQDVNPIGSGQNLQAAYNEFHNRLMRLFQSESLVQRGLMVSLSGEFPSYFAGKRVPKAPGDEAPKEEEDLPDPLAEPVATKPGEEGTDSAVEGPPAEAPGDGEAAPESAEQPIARAPAGARLVVIGDADFLRDDLVAGEYAQAGGPYTGQMSVPFFESMLDWLAEDRDLLELREKDATNRSMELVTAAELERVGPSRYSEVIRDRAKVIRWLNIGVPIALLLAGWLVIGTIRRARKRAFLAKVAQ